MSSFSNTDTGSKPADPYKEKNLEEPSLKEKVEALTSFVDKCKVGLIAPGLSSAANREQFCMMTTQTSDGLLASRCMALAAKESNGVDFIFHSNSESGKTDDIKEGGSEINLGFLNNSGEWASVSGKATIETNRDLVKQYYSPALKAWIGDLGDGKHDGGPEDPRIVLIKVQTHTAQYAVSRGTAIGGFVEVVKGVATGEAPSVNKLRQLSEAELQQWRSK
ncbi:hypothetical protein NA57DRAFT_64248 [Rhizodiscina lignyota]|uniref:General stress protein FMN-binding split barrel domain-containing protein n=1 Tax=Rhizodiscina lignyota TaxID=1504668 RepID=A0A9P4MDA5_9PEZI|nr:hypothetical protein NA57DRAFT_64248 [Rhizodiscina lignyota]